MKADPFAQLALLDVQDLDARADQLAHRRRTLPELAELADLQRERQAAEGQARDAAVLVEDLSREQAKADADVEQVRARRVRDQQRMDAGLVSNPKDLERMQHEMVSLQRRISDLEDVELEVMERLEEAQQTLATAEARRADLDERIRSVTEARDAAVAAIDEELASLAEQRVARTDGLPTDLLDLYDKLRAKHGGVGAAALRARQCGGCRLTLTSADLSRIAGLPVDEVVRCEECQRILVRTPESGL